MIADKKSMSEKYMIPPKYGSNICVKFTLSQDSRTLQGLWGNSRTFQACGISLEFHAIDLGCIPFDQSESGFFDRKLDFSIHFTAIRS